MPSGRVLKDGKTSLAYAESILGDLRAIASADDLARLMDDIARDFGFRYYALIHHDMPRGEAAGRVDIKRYPAAIVDRLFGQHHYRRDPVFRGCLFSGAAFMWSEIDGIITLDRKDRESFEFGRREGLNEGITVPYARLGDCMGSCTFAGARQPERAGRYLGLAQMVGVFAFQAAMRLEAGPLPVSAGPRLHPRPRDCVVLAGRGLSNKQIARSLAITPRTVDGYLTEARQLLDVHDRTGLVIGAMLTGEVGLHELRQPE